MNQYWKQYDKLICRNLVFCGFGSHRKQVFILVFKNSRLKIMKISFLKLFYEFSNSKNHNVLIYNKLKILMFNLKTTTYNDTAAPIEVTGSKRARKSCLFITKKISHLGKKIYQSFGISATIYRCVCI